MPKVATADSSHRAAYRAYFWSYTAKLLTEELAEKFGVITKAIGPNEFMIAHGDDRWFITGDMPACVTARSNSEQETSADVFLLHIHSLSLWPPWKVECFDSHGNVTHEYRSDSDDSSRSK
jgi:hypothetical protein